LSFKETSVIKAKILTRFNKNDYHMALTYILYVVTRREWV